MLRSLAKYLFAPTTEENTLMEESSEDLETDWVLVDQEPDMAKSTEFVHVVPQSIDDQNFELLKKSNLDSTSYVQTTKATHSESR